MQSSDHAKAIAGPPGCRLTDKSLAANLLERLPSAARDCRCYEKVADIAFTKLLFACRIQLHPHSQAPAFLIFCDHSPRQYSGASNVILCRV